VAFRNEWLEVCRRARILAGVGAVLCMAALFATAAVAPDEPGTDDVGVIEGADIHLSGPLRVDSVGGQIKTILRSGSDVRVRSGGARINLVEGGQIAICGPAHLSVLKSGGALTIALDSGVIHVRVDQTPPLTIYTPQIQAQPVAIGDDPREVLVGFETSGAICVKTYRGALRLEQQLSGQTALVPQGQEMIATDGQIEALADGAGHCTCELEIAKAPVPAAPAAGLATNAQAAGDDSKKGEVVEGAAASGAATSGAEQPTTKEQPTFTVLLPPLRYDATAKVQPEPDASLMVIVRQVRVRPALIFRGTVADAKPTAVATPAAPTSPPSPRPVPAVPPQAKAPPTAQPGVVDRMRSFFHSLWSKGE
jgi:hypothetical protein